MNDKALGLVRYIIKTPFLILILAATTTSSVAQDDSIYAFLPESYIRESAVKTVMPEYPDQAVRNGISGVVQLKLQIGSDGDVLKIKVSRKSDALLKKAAAEAARKWKFRPFQDSQGSDRSSLGRLTFLFAIRNGEAVVELYDPGMDAPDHQRLGYYDSIKELREWKEWEEITDHQ
jgi:TonB family protein